jgi:hypothetical protein
MSAVEDASIDLTLASLRLKLSYQQCLRLVLKGELAGERVDGRWRVEATAVERLAATRAHCSSVAGQEDPRQAGGAT